MRSWQGRIRWWRNKLWGLCRTHHLRMDALHISESELARDVHDVLARLRAGEEVVIEGGDQPLVLRASEREFRTIDEAIAGFRGYELEHGQPLMMDEDYAADMRETIANRKPRRTSA